jgi:DNA mismatch repair protein MutH
MNLPTSAPTSEAELLERAHAIAGLTLKQLADRCQQAVPANQLYSKGWTGQLLEIALGATAASLSEPDFQLIGVELKTIPLSQTGLPRESTYICTVPLRDIHQQTWRTSNVWRKLARVLWIPIQAEPSIALENRRIGMPLLWSPTTEQEQILRQDWEDLAALISTGQLHQITSRHGQFLQIRPKAAHARVLCDSIGETGELTPTLPRGFYLRTTFTSSLLRAYFV